MWKSSPSADSKKLIGGVATKNSREAVVKSKTYVVATMCAVKARPDHIRAVEMCAAVARGVSRTHIACVSRGANAKIRDAVLEDAQVLDRLADHVHVRFNERDSTRCRLDQHRPSSACVFIMYMHPFRLSQFVVASYSAQRALND